MTTSPSHVRLQMIDVHKRFGPTVALSGVNLSVQPGEVHALIGENGAGKSTLMKVLSGAIQPDAGRMRLDGDPFEPSTPQQARTRGIAMIYQELNLAPHLTVEQNIMLGIEESRFGWLSRSSMRRRVGVALEHLQHPDIQPTVEARHLSIGAQQLVEVARALVTDARIIVMDEPTSSLSGHDTQVLFNLIRRLRDRGVSIIYISHFLEEIRQIADRFTVLRDGETIDSGDVAETETRQIIEMMVGRKLDDMFPQVPHEPGEPILELQKLCGPTIPIDADLTLRRGEILGLFGLIGAGRTELLRALFGLDPVKRGQIKIVTVSGRTTSDRGAPPDRRLAQGIGMLSENRKEEGIALPMSIADNVTLSKFESVGGWGVINLRRQRAAAKRWIDRLSIRTEGPKQALWNLSGGNQQKVAIARLLHQEADVLLLDEPTRGVDVGAKVQISQLMGELAGQGKAILFVSSYLPELMGLCDRIAVMSRGHIVEVRLRSEWSEQDIMAAAVGGHQ